MGLMPEKYEQLEAEVHNWKQEARYQQQQKVQYLQENISLKKEIESLKSDILLMVTGHLAPSWDALSAEQWKAIDDAYERHTPFPEPGEL